eukprot:8545693-Ditylum_brightwellii.AAC.1
MPGGWGASPCDEEDWSPLVAVSDSSRHSVVAVSLDPGAKDTGSLTLAVAGCLCIFVLVGMAYNEVNGCVKTIYPGCMCNPIGNFGYQNDAAVCQTLICGT